MKAAVYVGTRNLYDDMLPAVKSILINSDVDKVYLLIEDDRFPHDLPDCVETINVSSQTFFRSNGPNYNLKWTYMTLMRAALPKIFPDLDVILSMDDDVIALQDVSDLWDLPIEDYYSRLQKSRRNQREDRIINSRSIRRWGWSCST